MQVTFSEFKRFLKDNIKLILVGAAVLTVILAAVMTFIDASQTDEGEREWENEDDIVLDASSAYFQFYAEYEEGEQFTNVGLIRQFLNLDDVQESISNQTNIDIQAIEEYYNEEFPEFDGEFTVMNINRNSNNNVFTVTVNTGNEQDNLRLAEHYYSLLMDNEIDFLNNKVFYEFVEPKINTELVEFQEEIEEADPVTGITLRTIVENTLVGIIVGLVIMVGIALLKAIFGQHLNYAFAYNVKEDDKFFLFDSTKSNQALLNTFVKLPLENNKIILLEDYEEKTNHNTSIEAVLSELSQDNTLVIDSLSRLSSDSDQSEIIIIVEPYVTTRRWYHNQLEVSDLYDMPTKVVQVNN